VLEILFKISMTLNHFEDCYTLQVRIEKARRHPKYMQSSHTQAKSFRETFGLHGDPMGIDLTGI